MHTAQQRFTLTGDLMKVALATGAFLLAPLLPMQFTAEVAWTGSDFAAAALLLGVAGFAGLRAARLRGPLLRRVALVGAVALAFAAVWVELAVGVLLHFGS